VATEAEIITRVRLELGDQPEPFRQTYRGTGTQDEFDLPVSAFRRPVSRSSRPTRSPSRTRTSFSNIRLHVGRRERGRSGPPAAKDWLLTAEGWPSACSPTTTWRYVHDASCSTRTGHADDPLPHSRRLHPLRAGQREHLDNLPEVEELPGGPPGHHRVSVGPLHGRSHRHRHHDLRGHPRPALAAVRPVAGVQIDCSPRSTRRSAPS
jgi:hypothetical protein